MKKTRPEHERKVIDKLLRLAGKTATPRTEDRIDFLSFAFESNLVDEIISYKLWDEGWEGLGERQWDTCFEMGDSKDVIAGVIRQANHKGFTEAVKAYCNDPVIYARWVSYSRDPQNALF